MTTLAFNHTTEAPPNDDTITLEGLDPSSEKGRRLEVTRKQWLAVAQIVAASDRVDARTVSRMFDPRPGDQIGPEAAEEIDSPLLILLEWTDRFSTTSIGISPSGVVVEDRHSHLDQTTSVFDFKWGWDDPGIDFDVLYALRNFVMDSGGFTIRRTESAPPPTCESTLRDIETQIERFMTIEDGEEPIEDHSGSGVESVLLGSISGKTVRIAIHVQPHWSDDFWTT